MSAIHPPAFPLPPMKEQLQRHGISANKALGQHFLLDNFWLERIVAQARLNPESCVIEIGPGPGGLTRALLEHGVKKVLCVEYDTQFIPLLHELGAAYPGRLEVAHADALRISEQDLISKFGLTNVSILSNLPYNISTQLLVKWLATLPLFRSFTLMFQKEVADRIIAAPGVKDFGRISVLSQLFCQIHKLCDVPASAFSPPPKIDSSVLYFTPAATPFTGDFSRLEALLKQLFGQRRKMLRQVVKPLFPDGEAMLKEAGIDPTQRSETLTLEQITAFYGLTSANRG